MMDTTPTAAGTPSNASDAGAAPADGARAPMKLWLDFASEARFSPGRRAFFKYRNLGVEEASNHRARAYQSTSVAGMLESTGWHHHICDFQFVYLMRGALILQFEDGTEAHLTAGDSMFIPGGVKHNEIYVSEDKDSIEFSMPEQIGTVPCERPDHLPETLRATGNVELVRAKMAAEQAAERAAAQSAAPPARAA